MESAIAGSRRVQVRVIEKFGIVLEVVVVEKGATGEGSRGKEIMH